MGELDVSRDRLRTGAVELATALLAGVGAVAGSYAVAGATPGFVAAPIAGFISRTMPGAVVTFAIVVLGDLGELLNLATALGLAVILLGLAAIVGETVGRRLASPVASVALAIGLTTLTALAVTAAITPSLAAGAAAGAVVFAATGLPAATGAKGTTAERRRLLGGLATALGTVAVGATLGWRATPTSGDDGTRQLDPPDREAATGLLGVAEERSLAIEGLEPLVSDEFYQVDINAVNPTVDADAWTLSVTGAVASERAYTYADIREMDAESEHISLRCVGESLNGRKMDNAVWTGVPIMDLVEPANPSPTCCVMLRAADGFFEEFPLAALEDGLLAYGMNGDVLPRAHGFPARALIPGHWGEINVKWLTEIEVLEEEMDGYWEQRGWHGTGPVNTVAKLHVVNHRDDGRIEVAGHAYAGTRGIDRVEVSTDGGDTWTDADLSEPLPGTDVWRQWAHVYEPPAGRHEVVVRATDGTGTRQPQTYKMAFPSGPSGWVRRTVTP